jgi:carbonic anhydrase
MKSMLAGFITTAALFSSVAILAQETEHHAHWAYEGKDGPKKWATLDPAYSECKVGHHQSPIDIRHTEKADLPPIQFDYAPSPLTIVDNGHTVMVKYEPGSFLTVGDHRYELTQFHFHHPSEEHINGKVFDMEIHLVHEDASGNMAVVAVLMKSGKVNQALQLMWDHLPKEKDKVAAVEGVLVNAADFLPVNHGYYTFVGSLTTPPCTEPVTWFVLRTPEDISREEVQVFANLYPHDTRPTQKLEGRVVRESK